MQVYSTGGKIIQLSMICKYTPAPYLDVVPEVLERHQSLLLLSRGVSLSRQSSLVNWLEVHASVCSSSTCTAAPPPPPSCIRRADGVSLWVMMYVCRRIFVIFLFTNKSEIIAWLQLPDRFVPDRPTRSG